MPTILWCDHLRRRSLEASDHVVVGRSKCLAHSFGNFDLFELAQLCVKRTEQTYPVSVNNAKKSAADALK